MHKNSSLNASFEADQDMDINFFEIISEEEIITKDKIIKFLQGNVFTKITQDLNLPLPSKSEINSIIYRTAEIFVRLQFERNSESLVDAIRDDLQLRTCFLIIVRASAIFETISNIEVIAARAITILNAAQILFSNMNLKNIRIPGALLQRSNFYKTNLERSDLSQVNFSGADLTLANFSNCEMDQVNFDQFPSCKIKEGIRYLISGNLCDILIGCENGEVIIFNIKDNIIKFNCKPDKSCINSLYWYNNDIDILVTYDNGKSYIINREPLKITTINLRNKPKIVAATVNRRMDTIVVACEGGFIKLLQYINDSLEEVEQIECLKEVITSITLSLDGHLIVGYLDGKVQIFINLQKIWSLSAEFEAHNGRLLDIHFDEESGTFASCGDDGIIRLWNVNDGKLIQEYKENSNARKSHLYYSQSDKLIAGGDFDGNVYLWDLNSEKPINQLKQNQIIIFAIKFDVQQNILMSIDRNGHVNSYNLNRERNFNNIRSVDCCKGQQSIGLSRNGKFISSATSEAIFLQKNHEWNILAVYSISTFLPNFQILCTNVNNDGTLVVAGGCSSDNSKGFIVIIKNGKLLVSHVLPDFIANINNITQKAANNVMSITISENDKYVIFGNNWGIISAFDVYENKIAWTDNQPGGWVSTIRCTKNIIIASVTAKKQSDMRILDLMTGKLIINYSFNSWINTASIDKAGKWIAAGGFDGHIYVWNINFFKNKKFFPNNFGKVLDVILSNDANFVVGAYQDNIIAIWNRNTYLIHSKIIHPDQPMQVFLFENEKEWSLISKSSSGTLRHWIQPQIPKKHGKKWYLGSENGHYALTATSINLEEIRNISRHNIDLLNEHTPVNVPSQQKLIFFENLNELRLKLYKNSINHDIPADFNYTNLVIDAIKLKVHLRKNINGNTVLHVLFFEKKIDKIIILLDKISQLDKEALKALLIKNNNNQTVIDIFLEQKDDYPPMVHNLIKKITKNSDLENTKVNYSATLK